MRYRVRCLDCKFEQMAKTKKEAKQIRSKHVRIYENPCDFFLELSVNVLIENLVEIARETLRKS